MSDQFPEDDVGPRFWKEQYDAMKSERDLAVADNAAMLEAILKWKLSSGGCYTIEEQVNIFRRTLDDVLQIIHPSQPLLDQMAELKKENKRLNNLIEGKFTCRALCLCRPCLIREKKPDPGCPIEEARATLDKAKEENDESR